jgi:hypothetical protein
MLKAATLIFALTMALPGETDAKAPERTPKEVAPLSEEWNPLTMITGFHSVSNKKARLAIRVLEADGSASVAENPVSLFVVATNGGTSDVKQHVWRLPGGVERVKKVSASKCGVDIQAEIDDAASSEPGGRAAIVIKACFIRGDGELESQLRIEEAN